MTWLEERRQSFSWSYSRADVFHSCPRRYYLRYYAPYPRNAPDETGDRRLLYVLGRIASSAMLAGRVVHALARDALRVAAGGRTWRAGVLEASSRVAMTRILRSSRYAARRVASGGSLRQAAAILDEHYYLPAGVQAAERAALERSAYYSERLVAHPLYGEALEHPDRVLAVERAMRLTIAGVSVIAVPDVILRLGDGRIGIVDWKTGTSVAEHEDQHAAQLTTYALVVAVNYHVAEGDLACIVADLHTGGLVEIPLAPGALRRAEERIALSIAELRALLDEPAANVASAGCWPALAGPATPLDELPRPCARCGYRRVCNGERVLGWAAESQEEGGSALSPLPA